MSQTNGWQDDEVSSRKSSAKRWMFVGGLVLIGLWLFVTYNSLVSDEEGIKASQQIVTLTIDKMEKKITGQGYVVKDFSATIKDVLAQTIGAGGRAANAGGFVTAVAERYPEVPEAVWRDLGATMNAEYESMFAAQSFQVDRVRTFKIKLRNLAYIPARFLGGFPTIDVSEYEKLITGSAAREARESGSVEAINPFEKKGEEPPAEKQ